MTNITTQTKNIKDNNTQQPQPQQPQQSEQPKQLDPEQAMQRPVKGKMVQPKLPKQNWVVGFSNWLDQFAASLGKALFTVLIINFLFQMAPAMQEKMPKLYQLYSWGAEAMEWMYETVFGLFGSLFRWELGEFLPQVWEGFKSLADGFIALF